jgi:hypothetical protein
LSAMNIIPKITTHSFNSPVLSSSSGIYEMASNTRNKDTWDGGVPQRRPRENG